jgi:thiamine biosynthesis lipoprotein
VEICQFAEFDRQVGRRGSGCGRGRGSGGLPLARATSGETQPADEGGLNSRSAGAASRVRNAAGTWPFSLPWAAPEHRTPRSTDNAVMPEPDSLARNNPAARPVSPATTRLPGLHRVEQIMGTAIGLDVRDASVAPDALEQAFEYLRGVDARFSPYRPESEVSRLIRGEIGAADTSPELREVLAMSEEIRLTSEGYFDIRGHRPDGRPDPTGLVKGWSLENAGRILESAGARNYCINGGGDIVARGEAAPGQAWRIGIRHPLIADALATVLAVRNGAVATSGAYERGEHIRDPFTGRAPIDLRSITIVGPSLTFADAYATAAFAMGPTGLAWVAGLPDYEGCAITTDPDADPSAFGGRVVWTAGFERYFADR